jgi:3-oxoacyl-[acyl-carrier protein] reductase
LSRIALVTGASRGIGRATAQGLAAAGHSVAVNYARSADAAAELVGRINGAGGTALAVQADVGDEAAVNAMFATIEETLGRVEILVNNAGVTEDNLLLRMSADAWDQVIETNLRSVYLCSKHAVRGMLRNRWGRIISISSVSGVHGNAGQANYAAAKAGIIGFTKSLSKEVGSRGITVNAIAPGFIETAMTDGLGDELAEAVKANISLGRLGRPEEVASAVSYLASDDAGYITGQAILVDGGLVM